LKRLALLLALAPLGCAQFPSGQCTDKAICDDTGDASIFDGSIGDAPADSPPDVPLDTLVGPDGDVPDGECNGGVEDCSNGVDDNCDGHIDCDDPLCQNAGYTCTPAAPAGWSGPVALYSIAGGTVPSCGGAYTTLAQSGHTGLTAPAATCGCTCSGATGELCFADIDYFTDSSCNNYNQSDGLPANFCVNVGSGNGSVKGKPGVAYGGTCTPQPTKNVPGESWSNSYATCSYGGTPGTAGCGATTDLCVQSPGSGAWSKPCVFQSGDVPCPTGDYGGKYVFYTSTSDSRGCTNCTCNYNPGSCTANITVYTGSQCSGSTLAISTDNQCHTFAGYSSEAGTLTNTPGTCPANPVSAQGTDTPAGPVTVCCAQ